MLSKIKNYLIYFFLVTPLVIFLILISKIILVRFYLINSRIGHLAEDFFLYLSKKNKEKAKNKVIVLDVFGIDEETTKANEELKKYIKNETLNLNFLIVKPIFFFIKILSNKFLFLNKFLAYDKNTKKSGYNYFSPKFQLTFDKNVDEYGVSFLKKKKINPNTKFVCLNLWTNAHLKNIDSSHHDLRNISIKSYIKTIQYLCKKDYYVFKIGRSNKKTIIKNCSNFIDFSYKHFDEKLDIYFLKNCYSYISSQSGLDYLAFALNKPILINSTYIFDYFIERPNIVYLLRPYFNIVTKKYISIDEIIFNYNLSFKLKKSYFDEKKILISENSEIEVLKAYKDLEYLINNKFKNTEKNKKTSNIFWNKFLSAKKMHGKDYEYYKNNKILSYYSWSNLSKKKL